MNNNEREISFTTENGEIKSKEDFLKDVSDIYDTFVEQMELEEPENLNSFEIFTDPENQVNPEEVLQSFDFMNRAVFLTDEIEMSHANSVFEVLKFWNKMDKMDEIPVEERAPINIYINTPGGDLDAVFSIISSIKLSKTPIHTYVIGNAYSGGFFIAIVGHKRFGFPYSSYMFHEGSAMDGGDAHKFIQKVDYYKTQLKKLKSIVIDNTKITSDQYEKVKVNDWFMSPDEALKYGVIDEIVENLD